MNGMTERLGPGPNEILTEVNPNSLGTAIGALSAEIDRFDGDIDGLAKRLMPIRTAGPDKLAAAPMKIGDMPAGLSPYTAALHNLVSRMNSLHQRLQQIAGEVEL